MTSANCIGQKGEKRIFSPCFFRYSMEEHGKAPSYNSIQTLFCLFSLLLLFGCLEGNSISKRGERMLLFSGWMPPFSFFSSRRFLLLLFCLFFFPDSNLSQAKLFYFLLLRSRCKRRREIAEKVGFVGKRRERESLPQESKVQSSRAVESQT